MRSFCVLFYLIFISFVQGVENTIPSTESVKIQEQPTSFEDLSIIVFSCDKYQELWNGFFGLLFKKWPSLKGANSYVPIYLVSNSKQFDDPRVITIKNENEKSWSDNALNVLSQIKTKYILVFLDDYFITNIDEQRLYQVFSFMKRDDVAYCQISVDNDGLDKSVRKKTEVAPGIAEKGRFEQYRTAIQACIWRTKDFKHILKPGESIWHFEIPGTDRSQGMFGKFLTVFENEPVSYLNMVQEGYLNSQNLMAVQKMGVHYQRGHLELDSDHKLLLWYKRKFRVYMYYQVWCPIKEYLKKFF